MKLIDEIKTAEENAEKSRKEAEKKGQRILEKEREHGEKELGSLIEERERLLGKNLAEANKTADLEIKKLQDRHKQDINKLKLSYEKNRKTAVKKVQEIILKWPSSH